MSESNLNHTLPNHATRQRSNQPKHAVPQPPRIFPAGRQQLATNVDTWLAPTLTHKNQKKNDRRATCSCAVRDESAYSRSGSGETRACSDTRQTSQEEEEEEEEDCPATPPAATCCRSLVAAPPTRAAAAASCCSCGACLTLHSMLPCWPTTHASHSWTRSLLCTNASREQQGQQGHVATPTATWVHMVR